MARNIINNSQDMYKFIDKVSGHDQFRCTVCSVKISGKPSREQHAVSQRHREIVAANTQVLKPTVINKHRAQKIFEDNPEEPEGEDEGKIYTDTSYVPSMQPNSNYDRTWTLFQKIQFLKETKAAIVQKTRDLELVTDDIAATFTNSVK